VGGPDAPCDHHENNIGYVKAGDWKERFVSVTTCAECVVQSQGYVQMLTGIVADPLVLFPKYDADPVIREDAEAVIDEDMQPGDMQPGDNVQSGDVQPDA